MVKCRTAQWAQAVLPKGMGAGGWHWNQVENKLSNVVWSIRKQILFISTGCVKASGVCGENSQQGIYSIRIMHIHSKVFPSSYFNKAIAGSHIQSVKQQGDWGEKVWHTAGWGSGCSPLATLTPKTPTSLDVAIQKAHLSPQESCRVQAQPTSTAKHRSQSQELLCWGHAWCAWREMWGKETKTAWNALTDNLTLTGSKASSFWVQHWLSNRGIIIIERYN